MKEISTLIWSEWRRQRKTVLLLLASTILLYLFMLGMVQFKLFLEEIEMTATALVIGLPFLYCIALGGSFANEFSDKSKSFLLSLPISKTKIYFSKYLSNLLMFLVISIVSSLLMYTLTDLTPGKAFFDDLEALTRSVAIITLLIVWILSHATVFLYNLISRNTNSGIIALLTFPIIFVIVSFGTASITMFFCVSDLNWIIAYTLLSSIIIYFTLIGLGWYLWNKRISKDLKTLKSIITVVIVLFVASALLYSFAYFYTKHQYKSAVIEAKQSGLELELKRKPQPAKIPDASNGMFDLMQFCKDEKQLSSSKTYEEFRKLCPSHYKSNLDGFIHMAQLKQAEVPKYILNNPDMRKLYSTIKKALKKSKIQYLIQYRKNNSVKNWSNYYDHLSAIRNAIYFLLDKAHAQSFLGDNKAFFETLTDIMKLLKFIKAIQLNNNNYTGRIILKNIYNTIIKAGPEGAAYTNNYIDALNVIKNDKIYNPPYSNYVAGYFIHYKKMPEMYRNKPIFKIGTSICNTSRFRQSLAAWIRNKIEYNNFYLEAKSTNHLKKLIAKYSSPYKYTPERIGPFISWNMSMAYYFILRSKIAGDKVCLALKIYRCRYGKYPESLQELCPEILKEIPLEPRTEKPYIYKREGKGFLLYGEDDKVLGNTVNSKCYYGTYYIKYQPWNPQGKEKRK